MKTEGPGDVFQENTWSQNILRGVCLEYAGTSLEKIQGFRAFLRDVFRENTEAWGRLALPFSPSFSLSLSLRLSFSLSLGDR